MSEYAKPRRISIESMPENASERIAVLLNSIDDVNSDIFEGAICHDVFEFRSKLIEKLTKDGYDLELRRNGWSVKLVKQG